MPKCLENFIVFRRNCAKVQPSSGLILEMLAGLNEKKVSSIVTAEHGSAKNLLDMAVFVGYSRVIKLVEGLLAKRGLKSQNIIENIVACNFTNKILPISGDFRGLRISKNGINSPFSKIRVKTLFVKAATNGNITIEIKDVFGNVLFFKPTGVVKGQEIAIEINQVFSANVIFIGFVQNEVEVYSTDCKRGGGCCQSICGNAESLFIVDGWNGHQITCNGYGIKACIELFCDAEALGCKIINRLAWPILYAAGIYILEEAQATGRISAFATHGQEWIEGTIVKWYSELNSCIEIEMLSIAQEVADMDRNCFPCRNSLTYIASTS